MWSFLVGKDRVHLGHVLSSIEWKGSGQFRRMDEILNYENRFALVVATRAVHRIGWVRNRAFLSWSYRTTFEFRKRKHVDMTGLENIVAFRLRDCIRLVVTDIEQFIEYPTRVRPTES
jgi:hypothetical protein